MFYYTPCPAVVYWALLEINQLMCLGVQIPLVASNRVGPEKFKTSQVTYYGGSIIVGQFGNVMKQLGATRPGNLLSGVLGIGAGTNSGLLDGHFDLTPERVEGHVVQEFDLDQCRMSRVEWVQTC
eukprot:GHRR01034951.1.p1 GENE.GHRR01034951.1~~GHRR01034951.1.p1  ORF type:complete len:125 (+),score=25.88 GHRR01034951.1:150-524(+)